MKTLSFGCARAGAIGLGAILIAFSAELPAAAADKNLHISACIDAVGTYLTSNFKKGNTKAGVVSRGLLSLTNGGHVFVTDSGEAGEPGYQPFSDGRGAWRCVSNEGGKATFAATILDFTFAALRDRAQQIARLDVRGTFDAAAQTLSGKTTLSFVPLTGDPFNPSALGDRAEFTFTGRKVEAP